MNKQHAPNATRGIDSIFARRVELGWWGEGPR
jgi:hypothetical protein